MVKPILPRRSTNKIPSIFFVPLLFINAALFLLPKLGLIKFVNTNLWGEINSQNLLGAIAQDLLLTLVLTALVVVMLRAPSRAKLAVAGLVGGVLLLLLLVDMRVRELWLKPIDISIIRYAMENAADLTSGADLFFNFAALYSMTFRKVMFFALVIFVVNWSLLVWAAGRGCAFDIRRPKLAVSLVAVCVLIFLTVALSAQKYRYRVNENILVSHLTKIFQAYKSDSGEQFTKLADSFEQKFYPLSAQLELKRKILKDVKPFHNVVVVVYESIRWKDLNVVGGKPTLSPVLAKMAASGIVSKSYVSVPHSSKAYYAILTGRHPHLGIEMREVFKDKNETLWHELRSSRQMNTYAFSSLFLGFEGMGKLLKSFGIYPYETRELAKAGGLNIASVSSFGTNDEHLYSLGSQYISKVGKPFGAVFFPLAAHFPYQCKGSVAGRHSKEDYDRCVVESDANLGKLLTEFSRLGLMKDTLFVIVGDHGESFGEHGLFVHNSSMYEEEVTVPLIFWSEDGRLGQHQIPYSRQIDIEPTIADLMGALGTNIPVQGVSLLRQQSTQLPVYMATFFDGLGAALVEPPFKYMFDLATNKVMVFDNTNDPLEVSPVMATDEKKLEVTERMRAFFAYQESVFPNR